MNESNIGGLSIRGIIAFVVIIALCWVCIYNSNDIKVGILKDIAIMILSFYFGQKTQPTQSITTGGNPDAKTTVTTNSGSASVTTEPKQS